MSFSPTFFLKKAILFFVLSLSFFFACLAHSQTYSFHSPLVDAADRGDIIAVKEWLDQGYPIDHKGDFQTTALSRAAFRGHEKIVEYLIKQGASINDADIAGASPLLMATRQGRYDIVTLLIAHGADINQADHEGWTPLMRANLADNKKLVAFLIEKGADPSRVNNAGHTALHYTDTSPKDVPLNTHSTFREETLPTPETTLAAASIEEENATYKEEKTPIVMESMPLNISKGQKIASHPGIIGVGKAIPIEEEIAPSMAQETPFVVAKKQDMLPTQKIYLTQKEGLYWANIASFSSEKEAQFSSSEIRKKNDIHSIRIVHSQQNRGRLLYSLQIGPFSTREKAQSFCLISKDSSKICRTSRSMKEANRTILREKASSAPFTKHSHFSSQSKTKQLSFSSSPIWLLFGSYPHQHLAEDYSTWLKSSFPNLLSKVQFKTELPLQRGERRIYRLKAGPLATKEEASHICDFLRKENIPCALLMSK